MIEGYTLIEMITSLGFPIVMCIWFMMRTEKIINNNTEAVNRVSIAVEACPKRDK